MDDNQDTPQTPANETASPAADTGGAQDKQIKALYITILATAALGVIGFLFFTQRPDPEMITESAGKSTILTLSGIVWLAAILYALFAWKKKAEDFSVLDISHLSLIARSGGLLIVVSIIIGLLGGFLPWMLVWLAGLAVRAFYLYAMYVGFMLWKQKKDGSTDNVKAALQKPPLLTS